MAITGDQVSKTIRVANMLRAVLSGDVSADGSYAAGAAGQVDPMQAMQLLTPGATSGGMLAIPGMIKTLIPKLKIPGAIGIGVALIGFLKGRKKPWQAPTTVKGWLELLHEREMVQYMMMPKGQFDAVMNEIAHRAEHLRVSIDRAGWRWLLGPKGAEFVGQGSIGRAGQATPVRMWPANAYRIVERNKAIAALSTPWMPFLGNRTDQEAWELLRFGHLGPVAQKVQTLMARGGSLPASAQPIGLAILGLVNFVKDARYIRNGHIGDWLYADASKHPEWADVIARMVKVERARHQKRAELTRRHMAFIASKKYRYYDYRYYDETPNAPYVATIPASLTPALVPPHQIVPASPARIAQIMAVRQVALTAGETIKVAQQAIQQAVQLAPQAPDTKKPEVNRLILLAKAALVKAKAATGQAAITTATRAKQTADQAIALSTPFMEKVEKFISKPGYVIPILAVAGVIAIVSTFSRTEE